MVLLSADVDTVLRLALGLIESDRNCCRIVATRDNRPLAGEVGALILVVVEGEVLLLLILVGVLLLQGDVGADMDSDFISGESFPSLLILMLILLLLLLLILLSSPLLILAVRR